MSKHRLSHIGIARPGRLPGPVHLRPTPGRIQIGVGWLTFPHRDRERVPDLDRPTVPPPRGRRGDEPADIVCVVDDSGSTAGTDSNGYRYVALRRIANLLVSGIGGDVLDDRVAVVHFADRPDPWLPLTPIKSKSERQRIRRALQPLTGGGTSIVPALERAAQLLGKAGDRLPVVLFFSDGESGESTAELTEAVGKLPVGSVHVVVLGDVLPDQWLDVPVSSVTALTDLQTADDFEWVLARALYRSLSLEWAGPAKPPKGTAALISTLHGPEADSAGQD